MNGLQNLTEFLPPVIAATIILIAAGVLGLFRSIALTKTAYTGTIESLQRQIEALQAENDSLRERLEEKDR